jgi:hypothetical protein
MVGLSMFWDSYKPFEVGDRIKYRPDPYSGSNKDHIGTVSEVTPNTYTVKWDDGTDDTLGKLELEAYCELIEGYNTQSYPNQCWHNWVRYQGFTRIYEYCTKCDQKRDIKI